MQTLPHPASPLSKQLLPIIGTGIASGFVAVALILFGMVTEAAVFLVAGGVVEAIFVVRFARRLTTCPRCREKMRRGPDGHLRCERCQVVWELSK